jgi:hypothetical protein
MKPTLFFFAFLALAGFNLSAQDYDTDIAEKCVDGLVAVGTSIVSDSLSPMTFYHKGDLMLVGVPGWFWVPRAYDDGDVVINGEDLMGLAGGIGGGYALTDRWLVFGVLSGMTLSGRMEEADSGYSGDVAYGLLNLTAGAGFDILRTEHVSWPVYAGITAQYYNVEFGFDTLSEAGGTVDATVYGSGFLIGGLAGTAATVRFLKRFSVTPYLLFAFTFSPPAATAEWDWTTTVPFPASGSDSAGLGMEPVTALLLGFNLGFAPSREWAVSLNTGTLISSLVRLNDINGQKGMSSLSAVLTVTWTKPAKDQ